MNYGYIRVSSDKQTVENQRFEINNFCRREGITIDGWIEETISGTKAYNKRLLGRLLKRIKKEDLIICAELSRLGRNLFMIMEILNICMTKEAKVWTIKDNYRLGDDIQSKVLAFAFGLSAEIERNLISQRTKEALARKRPRVWCWGAPKGNAAHPTSTSSAARITSLSALSTPAYQNGRLPRFVKLTATRCSAICRYWSRNGPMARLSSGIHKQSQRPERDFERRGAAASRRAEII